jgi:hypothetical protein
MRTSVLLATLIAASVQLVPLQKPYVVERVADRVFAVVGLYYPGTGPGVNAAFIASSRSIVFVDAGMTIDSAETIWREATARFPGRSRFVLVLTHFHADHVFGMSVFRKHGATVIAHRAIEPWLDEVGFKKRLERRTGKPMTFPEVFALEDFGDAAAARRVFGSVVLTRPDPRSRSWRSGVQRRQAFSARRSGGSTANLDRQPSSRRTAANRPDRAGPRTCVRQTSH